jgi:hypothetical protein
LDQLHATAGHAGQEDFRRRDFFTRASVLDRTVYDEVVVARAAQDAAKDVR